MPERALAPVPGRPVTPARFIPALPAGIGILPQEVTAARVKRPVPIGLVIFLIIAGVAALKWFSVWYSDYDGKRIDPVVTRAVLAHVPKGTRVPVTLWSGPRLLQIESALPDRQPGRAPYTIVISDVIDPKTGAKDPKYPRGADTLIEGVAITIR
jgi:hypothetical protein